MAILFRGDAGYSEIFLSGSAGGSSKGKLVYRPKGKKKKFIEYFNLYFIKKVSHTIFHSHEIFRVIIIFYK